MKILISTDTYPPHTNGASYFTGRLAHQLKARGHEVLVIGPSTSFSTEYSERNGIRVFGVRTFALPGSLMVHKFRSALPFGDKKKIERAIKDFNPDIVHFQGHFFISKKVFKIVKKNKIPKIGTNHFMPDNLTHYLHLPKKIEKKINDFMWKDFRNVFNHLDMVTSPTRTAAHLVKVNGFSKDVHAISCGIDLVRFHPSKKDEALRKKYNLPDVPLLFYVGRVDKEKNLDFVLKAVAQVPDTIQFHFALGGNGVEKKKLEALVKKLGLSDRVTFLGFIPDEDLPGVYATSAAFINAGTAELQCIAMMEAMASGLPVLGVNAVALPELAHHGENGFLFEMGDVAALAAHIAHMFSNEAERKAMGKKSLEIIEHHDIHKAMEQYEIIYDTVIKNKKS